MHAGAAAEDREREEDREDHEREPGHRQQRPTVARQAERDRDADGREQPVRRAEAAPGDDGQRDQQSEREKRLHVHGDRVAVIRSRRNPVRERVPDAAQRAGRGQVPVPAFLRVDEGPRVVDLLPQDERVDGGDGHRQREAGERATAVAALPRKHRQRRQQRHAGHARQDRQPGDDARSGEPAALGEHERRQHEEQVERLAVDRRQEERRREDREVEDGAPCSVHAEPFLGQPVQEEKSAGGGRKRDDDPGDDIVAEEDTAEDGDERRVERVESGRGPVVAVLRDLEEERAVPPSPDVRERAEVVQERAVPAVGVRVPVWLEPVEREQRAGPDRCAAPEEDPERRPRGEIEAEVAAGGAVLPKPLTDAHGADDDRRRRNERGPPKRASPRLVGDEPG
jgi:hypothetical protein